MYILRAGDRDVRLDANEQKCLPEVGDIREGEPFIVRNMERDLPASPASSEPTSPEISSMLGSLTGIVFCVIMLMKEILSSLHFLCSCSA